MGALGDFAPKSRGSCNRGGRVRHRRFISKSDGAAIRRGAALLAVDEGASAHVCDPSSKLTAFETGNCVSHEPLGTQVLLFQTKPGP
jgi:hypothetical protein